MKSTGSNVADLSDLQLKQFLSLISANSLEFIFKELVQSTKEWMRVSCCALWWLDTTRNGFRLAAVAREASAATDPDGTFLQYETAGNLGLLSSEEPVELPAEGAIHLSGFDLTTSLSARIHYEDRSTGILMVFPDKPPYSWPDSARGLLHTISRQGAIICQNFEWREKLTRLVEFLQVMSETSSDHSLYDLVLREGKMLFGCDRAVVRRVDLQSGHLKYVRSSPKVHDGFPLGPGKGVTGRALQERKTYRISDVTTPEWKPIYRPLWYNLPPTLSELAVPILLHKSRVHIKKRIEFVDKPFGVINFESPTKAAFSSLDQYCAEIIAQRMAPVMERIEFDRKLNKSRQAAQSLATKRGWDSIIDTLFYEIRNALGYEFVSLSLVDLDARVIRCIRAVGILKEEEFRKAAVHDLNSDTIPADVVRTGQTEVPSLDDPRLGSDFAERFELNKLIRVFVPMIVPSRKEVIGTICAGYHRTYREHIYERDVQLLKNLGIFAANAMESWRRGTIDRVSHEMNAPLTAVRGNLSRLRRQRKNLSDEQIELALEDMETDTQVLYYQVQQLEYILGGSVTEVVKQPLHTEPVLLFRDIIIKTINQLKPLVRDRGLDPKRVSYDVEDIYKVKRLSVDKSKISQVIFNLFMNAVKYSESPETFQIRIGADERRDHYIIKFCDWGIGIQEGLEEQIFKERFRAPLAMEKMVSGSGLGLAIARQLMREHGGDLILKNNHNPTEFHLIIPKHIKETS
jgi:signal transduction histidine kinase